jgi:protein involved in polysaccharide export with SLBB domain
VREKLKQLIAQRLIERGKLKTFLQNLEVSGLMTEEIQNKILDDLLQLDKEIQEFEAIYKSL